MQNNKPFLVKIKNFQSLSEANLELPDGLTIVTGATNNGKSAIVRAVEAAVFNDGVDEYIKAGTDELSVTLDNGEHKVEYIRKSKGRTDKTTYQFDDGKVQQKVGRSQLPEMDNMFNIREVRLQNNQRARLNFWYQNEKPFLMDKTAGQLYEFLSVSSSEKYLAVLKAMSADMKQEESDMKILTASIDTLKRELALKQDILDRNNGFYSLYDILSVLKKNQECLGKAESLLTAIDDLIQSSCMLNESLQRVTARIDVIPMERVLLEMGRFTKESERIGTLKQKLSDIERVAGMLRYKHNNFSKVSSLSERNAGWIATLQDRIEAVAKMQTIVSDMSQKENEARQYNAHINTCKARLAALPVLRLSTFQQATTSNKIVALEKDALWLLERRKNVTAVMSAASLIKEVQNALQDVIKKLNDSDKEIEIFMHKTGVCPFCGAVFSEGHAVCKPKSIKMKGVNYGSC